MAGRRNPGGIETFRTVRLAHRQCNSGAAARGTWLISDLHRVTVEREAEAPIQVGSSEMRAGCGLPPAEHPQPAGQKRGNRNMLYTHVGNKMVGALRVGPGLFGTIFVSVCLVSSSVSNEEVSTLGIQKNQ